MAKDQKNHKSAPAGKQKEPGMRLGTFKNAQTGERYKCFVDNQTNKHLRGVHNIIDNVLTASLQGAKAPELADVVKPIETYTATQAERAASAKYARRLKDRSGAEFGNFYEQQINDILMGKRDPNMKHLGEADIAMKLFSRLKLCEAGRDPKPKAKVPVWDVRLGIGTQLDHLCRDADGKLVAVELKVGYVGAHDAKGRADYVTKPIVRSAYSAEPVGLSMLHKHLLQAHVSTALGMLTMAHSTQQWAPALVIRVDRERGEVYRVSGHIAKATKAIMTTLCDNAISRRPSPSSQK